MKRFICLMFIVLSLMFSTFVMAADVPTTWKWDDTNDAGTVASWNIFKGTSATGPWTVEKNQVFYDKGAAVSYQTSDPVTVPNNAQTTVWFKANTVGTSGLTSADSNIISVTYDTRVTPIAPVIVEVTRP